MSSRAASKPTFLNTKGQRNQQADGIYTGFVEDHYRQIAGGSFVWDGTPDDMPTGFIEDTALFYAPGVGCKKVRSLGNVVLPIKPSTLTVYGRPYDWIPTPLDGMMPLSIDSDLFSPSRDPALWLGVSVRDLIDPYLAIMNNALMTLQTNLDGLNQPIVLNGVPGGELGTLVLKDAILNKDRAIPTTGTGFQVQALDLKAQDHTQNLISTIDWCDSRILEVMAASNGMEKSSGVTTMETVSGVQSVMQQLQIGLEKRRAWCDEVNDRFGMSMSVRFGDGIASLMSPQSNGNAPQSDDDGAEVSKDD